MFYYAGIDEAGYGPMFGPMVHARVVMRLNQIDAMPQTPPDLWQLLHNAVCRKPSDRKRRIAVNDSKKLYKSSGNLANLERGVLAALGVYAPDRPMPDMDQLLKILAHDPAGGPPQLPWYQPTAKSLALPHDLSPEQIPLAVNLLNTECRRQQVEFVDCRASVVYEDRYNHWVDKLRSKSRLAWMFIAQHLAAIRRGVGEHPCMVCIDRQGGRTHYRDLLQLCFADARITVISETPELACYDLQLSPGLLRIAFMCQGEQVHLPIALASMTAKYIRQLAMIRFNQFFIQHMPDLKPTAGYVQDGRRFLEQIEPILTSLQIRP